MTTATFKIGRVAAIDNTRTNNSTHSACPMAKLGQRTHTCTHDDASHRVGCGERCRYPQSSVTGHGRGAVQVPSRRSSVAHGARAEVTPGTVLHLGDGESPAQRRMRTLR